MTRQVLCVTVAFQDPLGYYTEVRKRCGHGSHGLGAVLDKTDLKYTVYS